MVRVASRASAHGPRETRMLFFCSHMMHKKLTLIRVNRFVLQAGRELLSPETGLRQDGRRANELRKIRCRLGATSSARRDTSSVCRHLSARRWICVF